MCEPDGVEWSARRARADLRPYSPSLVTRTVIGVEMNEFRCRARTLVSDGTLGYDQKIRRLATLATEALPYPALSEACREALDERVICDLYEGNAPFAPRYVLPDYGRAMNRGIEFLELSPPTDLDDALAFLQIMYAHVPSVTTYPVCGVSTVLGSARNGSSTGGGSTSNTSSPAPAIVPSRNAATRAS